MKLRTIMLTALVGFFCTSAVTAQLVAFPSWFLPWVSASPSSYDQFEAPIWAYVHPDLKVACEVTRTGVREVRMANTTLRSLCGQAIIAIHLQSGSTTVDYGGIDSGLYATMALDGPYVRNISGVAVDFTLATGVGLDGYSRVHAIVKTTAAGNPQFTLFPLPFVGLAGELFVAGSVVGEYLYVADGGSSPKIIRYVDSNADSIWDSRDPGFVVDLTTTAGLDILYPLHILGFAPSPNVEAAIRYSVFENMGMTDVIVPVGGSGGGGGGGMPGFTIRNLIEDVAAAMAISLPAFNCSPSANQDRLLVSGSVAASTIVEAGPTDNGPWSTITVPLAATEDFEVAIISLTRQLTSGEYVRIRRVGASSGHVRKVADSAPAVFEPRQPFATPNAQSLTFTGDNLNNPALVVRIVHGWGGVQPTTTLIVTGQSKYHLEVGINFTSLPQSGQIQILGSAGEVYYSEFIRVE